MIIEKQNKLVPRLLNLYVDAVTKVAPNKLKDLSIPSDTQQLTYMKNFLKTKKQTLIRFLKCKISEAS